MAGGISVHAVDVSHGRPAQGMRVDVYSLAGVRKLIANGKLASNGLLNHPITHGDGVTAGTYEVVFHVGDYLKSVGAPTSTPPFLDTVPFRFTIADAEQHYHLPLKFTPWGFSLFRGS